CCWRSTAWAPPWSSPPTPSRSWTPWAGGSSPCGAVRSSGISCRECTMRANAWGYVFGEALRSLWRNGFMSLASVTTVAICLAVLAIILLVAVNLQYMASFVESQVEVVAFVDGSVDRAATRDLEARIEALPGVREGVFVSREAAVGQVEEQCGEHRDRVAGLGEPAADQTRGYFA